MSRQITQPLLNTAPLPLDAKKGPFIGIDEATAIAAALAAIPEHGRHLGLTVILIINDVAEDYYFKNSIGTLVKKNTATADDISLATGIDVTDTLQAIQTAAVSAKLVLETNKPITRNFSSLNGLTINRNTAGAATGNMAHLIDFINAIFFPFNPHTIACAISGATTREVNNTTVVTITATVTKNNDTLLNTRQLFVRPAGEAAQEIVGVYAGFTWNNVDPAPGSYGNKVVSYIASVLIEKDDLNPPTMETITATKTINYIYPIFVGKAAAHITTGAELLVAIGASNAVKKLTNSSFTTSGGESTLLSTNDGTYKFIAVPAALTVTAFASGLDGGVIPGASPTSTFQASGIKEDDFVSADFGWGIVLGGVPYKIYNTHNKVAFDVAGVTFTIA